MELPAGTYNTNYARDRALVRTRAQWVLLISFLILLFLIPPMFASRAWLDLLIRMAILVIAVHGLNIIMGYCGLPSMGHSAFMAVGAYTSALLATRADLPFWVAMPLGGLAAAAVGAFFGLAALRVKGFYIAITTIAAQVIIAFLITAFASVTGGKALGLSVPPASAAGFAFDNDRRFYFIAMGVALIMTYLALNLGRSRIGRAFVAIRDNDIAAEAMGVRLFRYKMLAFAIGCFYAGVAGSLLAHWRMFINLDYFTFADSIWMLGTVIVGGAGTTVGPVLGVAFVQGLKQLTSYIAPKLAYAFPAAGMGFLAGLGPVVFGLVLMIFLILQPRGIAHAWHLLKSSYRLHPFSK